MDATPAWSCAAVAASKAVRAVAASARAGGFIEASAALIAAACAVDAVAKAAEADVQSSLQQDPEFSARSAAAGTPQIARCSRSCAAPSRAP